MSPASRQWVKAAEALLVCVVVGLICAYSQAQAALTHAYLSSITEIPSGAASTGGLSEVNAMTVRSTDLWVAELIEGEDSSRIDEFDSGGTFVRQIVPSAGVKELAKGIAVGEGGSETQIFVGGRQGAPGEEASVLAVLSPSGTLLGRWSGTDTPDGSLGGASGVEGVAFDGSTVSTDWAKGDVYVDDAEQNLIDVFKPEAGGKESYVTGIAGVSQSGAFFGDAPSEPFSSLAAVAVDAATGELIVAEASMLDVLKPTGLIGEYELVERITETPDGALERLDTVAIDPSSGEIYAGSSELGVVYQFSGSGAYLGDVTGTPSSRFPSGIGGIAVDPVSQHLYVGQRSEHGGDGQEGAVDVYGPDVTTPEVATDGATAITTSGATLTGAVDPEGAGAAECEFQWGASPEFGHTVPCTGIVADGSSYQAVESLPLTGLNSDTTYYYRLEAQNESGLSNLGNAAEDHHFKTRGPALEGVWASKVTSTSATLDAQLNPAGNPTYYYFEYGVTTGYGNKAPTPNGTMPDGILIGAGEADVTRANEIAGLAPGTTYDYRLVATSEVAPGIFESVTGVDHVFTTEATPSAFELPDGRAWEMVSPVQKQGALIEPIIENGIVQAAATGDAVTYLADAPTDTQTEGYSNFVQVLSTRNAGGWSSRDIATPHNTSTGITIGLGFEYRAFSADLSQALVEPQGEFTPLSVEASERTAYLREDQACAGGGESCYKPLVTSTNVMPGTKFGGNPATIARGAGGAGEFYPGFVGGTPTLGDVVLESDVPLTEPHGGEDELYEWSAGRLQLVSVLPQEEGEADGAYPTKAKLGDDDQDARNAISTDGSQIVWTGYVETEVDGEVKELPHLYVRDMATKQTTRLDVPQAATTIEPQPEFQGASASGDMVFFTDTQPLTANARGRDLYACQITERSGVPECKLTDLTPDGHSGESAGIEGSLEGTSEDGTYVYFVASGALANGAVSGGNNLYVERYDAGLERWNAPELIASLAGADFPDWGDKAESGLDDMTARVAPNGAYLAFMSQEELTGYDTHDENSGRPDEEVYLYNAQAKRLMCASCNPMGARPVGVEDTGAVTLFDNSGIWAGHSIAANVPGWTAYAAALGEARYQSRYLSDDGRLFFNSSDSLVPHDTNGTEDVYEYEPASVGSCTTASATFSSRSDGCVDLISSGTATGESAFLDASQEGTDVFFLTSARLAAQDMDESVDVYDAHECTSAAPCGTSAAPEAPCSSEAACRPGVTSLAVPGGAFGTAAFSGPGNSTAVPAKAVAVVGHPSRAQELANALRNCRKKAKRKRAKCERRAKIAYGRTRTAKRSSEKKGKRR